jgi:hypothetical protein
MIHLVMIFLSLLVMACGQSVITIEKPTIRPFYIDKSKVSPVLLPYVMEFAGHCEKFNTSEICERNFRAIYSIETVPFFAEKGVVGMCRMRSDGVRKIEIREKWVDSDSLLMRTVILHEMAHCTLGAGSAEIFPHYDNSMDIMNSYVPSEKDLFLEWPKLIKAVFLRAGGKTALTESVELPTITKTTLDDAGGFTCETRED